jgi:hypothetical protein
MSTNVRNVAMSRRFLSDRPNKNSIYPVPAVTEKIFKKYSPHHPLLSGEILLLKEPLVVVRPNVVKHHLAPKGDPAEEIRP